MSESKRERQLDSVNIRHPMTTKNHVLLRLVHTSVLIVIVIVVASNVKTRRE